MDTHRIHNIQLINKVVQDFELFFYALQKAVGLGMKLGLVQLDCSMVAVE